VEVKVELLGYHFQPAEECCDDIVTGSEGEPLKQLDPDQQDKILPEPVNDLN